jgi:hypothetical protein
MPNMYKTAGAYLETCASREAKIAALNEIQNALITTAMKAVQNGHISQYSMNNGQTIIQETYRSPAEVMEAYNKIEQIKQMLVNQGTRVVRLLDLRSFNGGR